MTATISKFKGVAATSISKIAGLVVASINKIKGALLIIGGWDMINAKYNVENGSINGRERGNKQIYFKPDGSKMYSTGENSFTAGTNGYLTCGTAAEDDYSVWAAVTDGSFAVTIDSVDYNIAGIDFTGVSDMDDVAGVIQTAIRTATGHLETCVWSTDHFIISSVLGDSQSSVSVLSTIYYGTEGTDISGVDTAWMDGENGVGTPTAGTTSALGGVRLQEFTLSIPWDVTTMRYTAYFDLLNESPYISDCKGLIFSADGLKLFVATAWEDITNPEVYYSFTMSVAWDLSTLSYDSKSYDYSSDGINCHGLEIKADGTKLWAVDYGVDGGSTDSAHIIQYTFGTAWDLSTLSKDAAELDLSNEMTYCNSFFMNAAGTRIFAVEKNGGEEIHQYNLSTPYDLSSGSYASKALDYSSASTTYLRQPYGIFVSSDGYYIYVLGTYENVCYKVRLADSWELNNAYMPNYVNVTSQTGDPMGVCLSALGTKMYVISYQGYIYQYTLEIAYDVRSATYDSVSYNFSATEANCRNIAINNDGSKLYLMGSATRTVYEIDLSTPYDLSTASYTVDHNFSIQPQTSYFPHSFCFNIDGTKMYALKNTGVVYQYTLTTAWDVTSAGYDSVSLDISSTTTDRRGVNISADGTLLYISDINQYKVHQYLLPTPFVLTSAAYNTYFETNKVLNIQPRGTFFKSDGSKLYISDSGYNYIFQTDVS